MGYTSICTVWPRASLLSIAEPIESSPSSLNSQLKQGSSSRVLAEEKYLCIGRGVQFSIFFSVLSARCGLIWGKTSIGCTEPSVFESIKAAVNWGGNSENTVRLNYDTH